MDLKAHPAPTPARGWLPLIGSGCPEEMIISREEYLNCEPPFSLMISSQLVFLLTELQQ